MKKENGSSKAESKSVGRIRFPGIEQKDFAAAVQTLEGCKQPPCPERRFPNSYFSPGGYYKENWWQLDLSLVVTGYKWIDQDFSEKALLNFESAQREDGRIPLWGPDLLPQGSHISQQKENVSSLPKVFEAAAQIGRRSANEDFINRIYETLKKYFQWWWNCRRDERTGLFSAVFEETFAPYLFYAGEWAPPDTNMELVHGCGCLAAIAARLNLGEEHNFYLARQKEIQEAVVKHLWDGDRKAFFPYLIKERKLATDFLGAAFAPLRCGTALPEQKDVLMKLLFDDAQFNWNAFPLTSVNRQDTAFTVVNGKYVGNPCWLGSVWTLIKENVVRGLKESGENVAAASLALKTVRMFNGNYAEFLNPLNGKGQGAESYAWSAAQYLELLLDVIFGRAYDARKKTFSVAPSIPQELYGNSIALNSLALPDGSEVSVNIDCQEQPLIECELNGEKHSGRVSLQLRCSEAERTAGQKCIRFLS